MSSPRPEVADVFRQHGQEFLERWGKVLSSQQRKAFRDIGACRTSALGTQVQQCDHCGRQQIAYRSCRNRQCPKCHSRTRDEWLRDLAGELLPVPYCHVVFTLPHELTAAALRNPRVVYAILFQAVAESLMEMAADPKRLRARLGFLAVLHTWTQRLELHPHIHCVVPAGRVSPVGQRWVSPRKAKFFLPVKPLGRLFRGKFLDYLEEAFAGIAWSFMDGFKNSLTQPAFNSYCLHCIQRSGSRVKPPFGGPKQVLRYPARYTHRVAISNGCLLKLENGHVHFRWRGSQQGNQIKKRHSTQSNLSGDSFCTCSRAGSSRLGSSASFPTAAGRL